MNESDTLFLGKTVAEQPFVQDQAGHTLSFFSTEEEAVKWCKEHGYRLRDDSGEEVRWLA